jgi:threonine aldolase
VPRPAVEALHRRGWHFYSIAGGERFMCSWDTEEADVRAFALDLRAAAAGA